jgi:hypothetical protein
MLVTRRRDHTGAKVWRAIVMLSAITIAEKAVIGVWLKPDPSNRH